MYALASHTEYLIKRRAHDRLPAMLFLLLLAYNKSYLPGRVVVMSIKQNAARAANFSADEKEWLMKKTLLYFYITLHI